MSALRCLRLLPLVLVVLPHLVVFADDWPQAAGPNGNFVAEGDAPSEFSVTHGRHVAWKTPLPGTGQGTAIVCGGRVFVTSHEPVSQDAETGAGILGMCFDAETGKELWRRELPGVRETDLSSLFSDNTAASPAVHDGRVCFMNVGGSVKCFDFEGHELWSWSWVPFGRHHARMHEPILAGDRVILLRTLRNDLPLSATTKEGAYPLGRGRDLWMHLQAVDLKSGQVFWTAQAGTSVHSTPMIGQTSQGRYCILAGRGGGHQPPEEPYGLSLIDTQDGSSVWDLEIDHYPAAQNAAWNATTACLFTGREHRTVDIATGRTLSETSLVEGVSLCRFANGGYSTEADQSLPQLKKAITNQSNCLVGSYHWFRAHDDFLIGRVDIRTGKVEYLQVPVQVVRRPGYADEPLWNRALPNDMKNADGFVVTQDRRNAGNGWGHVSAASPVVVGDLIYMPTMIGMVYVLKWNVGRLDEHALVSISDLGPAQQTWSLSSLSFADGKLYARTLKELICIGTVE